MYSNLPNLILGFHGCDQTTKKSVLLGKRKLIASNNEYDWLGHGIYFWENDEDRALQFAKEKKGIKKPTVIGAVLDLGECFNLIEQKYLEMLKRNYEEYVDFVKNAKLTLPSNRTPQGEFDLLLRHLDCAVIEFTHAFREMNNSETKSFDSVRGVFWEGDDLYPNAGFKEKNHIQICVRNPNCIKGYFDPLKLDNTFPRP